LCWACKAAELSRFSLFLSHINQDASLVVEVASQLNRFGLNTFAAPQRLRGSDEWLPIIENELLTCDALVAFLRPSFRASKWTDQEIGYVLGRRKRVFALTFDSKTIPYGFISKYHAQHVSADSDAKEIAELVIDLMTMHLSRNPLVEAMICENLEIERNRGQVVRWLDRIEKMGTMKTELRTQIAQISRRNTVISGDSRLAGRCERLLDEKDKDRQA
jgi:hypothetical protein